MYADPFGLVPDDIYYDEYGEEIGRLETDEPDRYFLVYGGQTYTLDYGLRSGATPYTIFPERSVDPLAARVADLAPRGYDTDLELTVHSLFDGSDLDFKQY